MPADMSRSKNDGSTKEKPKFFESELFDKSKLTVCPRPRKLRSSKFKVKVAPSAELNDAPKPRLPVGFSTTLTSIIAWSGDEPSRVSTFTDSKKPVSRIRSVASWISRRLNASPSANSNWRRITRSKVVEFPSISMRSTNKRLPRDKSISISSWRKSSSREIRGRADTKA